MARGIRRTARSRDRQDGAATRTSLLEAGGAVFAEFGFDRATAKEIALRAGTNAAAVNYHFGGIEALYEDVLAEAHHRLMSYDVLARMINADIDPKEKLRRFIGLLVTVVRTGNESSWPAKVIVRELIAPTPHIDKLRREEIEPKKALLFGVIAQILGVPPDHPLVAQAALSTMAPCFMLLVAEKRVSEIIPALGRDATTDEELADRLVRFTLGGLAHLSLSEHADRPSDASN
ncbi:MULTISPECIES: CerR family C-terminal domain-containing protein [unclassified Rhizobium]|uniref:CerR family C-terminal domain-containing protein n=1 Tax=unclassified Rhizobium TaxID=2613769 RepID=UPI000DDC2CA5|nr:MULTISPECIES: CerR family C-terminal domain-containing protein [unclassified Rhizobium]MBB3285099.1 AcrR family transcriptional regulator [Rhizobium sp. BK252]MBB3399838.1 AcrR family transcriptional regulator [Rhizobium sp. BK289]MBB3412418.1 AcrR family transcriptional regulator [Rhizobium sp. BK284]MBB3480304.1 AcrR family transcriptional regulator [Rhizobium sp. BK347]MDK4718977.1 CerR family C-terminal domain-containing protein [Rhizobium sp. CNPSo 3968]